MSCRIASTMMTSLVVLDIKRENHQRTGWHRENVLGQEVFLFSPLAEDGATHCWNPVGGIDEFTARLPVEDPASGVQPVP